MSKQTIAFYFTVTLASMICGNTSVTAESLQQRCQSNEADCKAIYDASKLIDPTYNTNIETSKEQITNLGWDKEKTSLIESKIFIDPKDPEITKKVSIDAQVVISQKEVNGKTIYLFSFRGTENPLSTIQAPFGKVGTDGGTDANIGMTKWAVGKVHTGFLDYITALESDPKLRTVLKEILDKQIAREPYEVITTGHSLGGAAAQLFTARLLMSYAVDSTKIKNIVFGAPSVGDKDFTDTYLRNTLKVEINTDAVPGLTKSANVFNKIPDWLKNNGGGNYYHNYGQSIQIPSSKWNLYEKKIQTLKKERNFDPVKLARIQGEIWRLELGKMVLAKDDHTNYPTEIDSIYKQQSISLLNGITSITQSGSSHIGSASSYLGRSPNQDRININNPYVVEQNTVTAGAKPQTIQEKSQYTNGQIIRTPFDITLTWNQNGSTQLDLDSHLATPNGQHVFFQDRGNLDSAPNAFLYRDVISQKGAEQTRVTKLQDGEYRFYIHNYSDGSGNTSNPNRLSNSSAQVKIFEGGKPLTNIPNDPNNYDLSNPNIQAVGNPYPNGTFNVPTNTPGNTWSVFRLNARTGILTPVNTFGNASTSDVPKLR
jgi:hypothetical protein